VRREQRAGCGWTAYEDINALSFDSDRVKKQRQLIINRSTTTIKEPPIKTNSSGIKLKNKADSVPNELGETGC